jgi:hypothetical protein
VNCFTRQIIIILMETIKDVYARWDSAVLSTARVGFPQCSKHRHYRIALEFGAMRARIAYERAAASSSAPADKRP